MCTRKSLFFVFISSVLLSSFSINIASAATIMVDCSAGNSIQAAVDNAVPGDVISTSGTCEEIVKITTNDLTLIGDESGSNTVLSGAQLFFPTLIKIESAVRVKISGFDIVDGLFGIHAVSGASLSLSDSLVTGMIIGINMNSNSNIKLQRVTIEKSTAVGLDATSGATVEIVESFSAINNIAFGLDIIDGAEIRVARDAVLTLTGNLLGAQISGGATMFVDEGGSIIADNNILIGFSINTGASMVVFNGDVSASGNGLDGLDVVSSASLDIDGNSTLTVSNNRREGISIDNGSINIFGFFSTEVGLPRIIANNNTNNGIQVEFGSKLDIGRNSSIQVMDNGQAGISLDDGSSANIHDSEITGNNGVLLSKKRRHQKHHDEDDRLADIVATFGSRISFNDNNNIGLVLCDRSSMARGDVECND